MVESKTLHGLVPDLQTAICHLLDTFYWISSIVYQYLLLISSIDIFCWISSIGISNLCLNWKSDPNTFHFRTNSTSIFLVVKVPNLDGVIFLILFPTSPTPALPIQPMAVLLITATTPTILNTISVPEIKQPFSCLRLVMASLFFLNALVRAICTDSLFISFRFQLSLTREVSSPVAHSLSLTLFCISMYSTVCTYLT